MRRGSTPPALRPALASADRRGPTPQWPTIPGPTQPAPTMHCRHDATPAAIPAATRQGRHEQTRDEPMPPQNPRNPAAHRSTQRLNGFATTWPAPYPATPTQPDAESGAQVTQRDRGRERAATPLESVRRGRRQCASSPLRRFEPGMEQNTQVVLILLHAIRRTSGGAGQPLGHPVGSLHRRASRRRRCACPRCHQGS